MILIVKFSYFKHSGPVREVAYVPFSFLLNGDLHRSLRKLP
jgi:hypothetical protein